MLARRLLVVFLAACSLGRAERIGDIEFFGYKGLELARVRAALPLHAGDEYQPDSKARVTQAVTDAIGKAPTDVAAICCDETRNVLLFIGLPGASSKSFTYNPQPKGNERLSSRIVDLYRKLDRAIEAAVQTGGKAAQEDDFNGYSLINDPTARSLELRVHEWALKHQNELIQVLKFSSGAEDRRIASDALGYGPQKAEQISALVHAARDADDDVRNNATRASGVLVRGNKAAAEKIPPEAFIDMLNSGLWTDRNKSASLLMELTRDRRLELLLKIRAAALDSLMDMAAWRDAGHAYFPRIILGRVAGIPEGRLAELAWKDPAALIAAAHEMAPSERPNPAH